MRKRELAAAKSHYRLPTTSGSATEAWPARELGQGDIAGEPGGAPFAGDGPGDSGAF